MAIGERIHFFRTKLGITQKLLGIKVGFPESNADVRMAQYETGTRTPKAELTASLAKAFGVSSKALDVPDIDSYVGLMHTLFTLEDIYGLKVGEIDGEVCIVVDKSKGNSSLELLKMICAWNEQAQKLKNGEITKEEYDCWRYCYPELDETQIKAKIPSQDISELFIE